MLELQRAKEIKGTVELPPNPDFFLMTLVTVLGSNKAAHVTPVIDTPLISLFKESFSSQLDILQEGESCTVTPKEGGGASYLQLPYEELPYRDFIVFLLLGLRKTVAFKHLPPKRLDAWQKKAENFGLTIESREFDDAVGLSLSSNTGYSIPQPVEQNSLHHCLGLAFGLKENINIIIEYPFQSPLRYILPAFGYEVTIKSNYEKKSPLLRRLSLVAPKSQKKSESKISYSVSMNFSAEQTDPVSISLPGDDVLGAILIAAKSLIQRGQLILSNIPLESWSCATLAYIRKMGRSEGIQEERQTSFGSSGTAYVHNFKLLGYKMECTPLYQYNRQLPAIVTIATFAKGQSVFRGLEELRNETPDGIEQLLSCVLKMGGRHGEMPDGIVIDGAKQYDGFDLSESISAAANGACAVAGLKCNGKTSINDSQILQRWPSFKSVLDTICKFR